MFIVYLITNLVNGKSYVGKTERTLRERWLEHLSFSRCGAAWMLSRAFRKYGAENFEIVPIDFADESEELNELEMFWVSFWGSHGPNGYNMTDGGEGVSGRKMSEEAKRKISVANTGRTHTPETRERLRISHLGKKLSEEQKAKIGKASKGHIKSEETRKKLSVANTGKAMPEYVRKKLSIATSQKSGPTASHFNHNISTEEIKTLKESGLSNRQIARKLGIDKSTVKDRLKKVA